MTRCDHRGSNRFSMSSPRSIKSTATIRRINKKREMKTYYVKFSYDGEGDLQPQVRRYQATSPGHAFKKCVSEFPGAKLIEGWSEGGLGINYGCITYAPPSTVRIVAEPAPKAEETKFPFYDECLGTRRPFSG